MTLEQLSSWAVELLYTALNHGHTEAFAIYIDQDTIGEAFNAPLDSVSGIGGEINGIPIKPIPEGVPDSILMYLETECYPYLGMTFRGDLIQYHCD